MNGSQPTPDPDPNAQEWYCATCDRSFGAGTQVCPDDGTRLVLLNEGDPLIGREIDGRFVIRERLGRGGMGVVYRAWQASVGREVAVKVIRPRPGHDAATTKRFLREAKLASQLSQPSTVGVIDFGQGDDNILYLVMELLRGRTLAEVLRDHGRMSPERAVRIGAQICDALEAAHRLGIVHRDLKPANVMILDDPPGRDLIKVLDFGLAKVIDADESTVTQSGRLVGTPSHLPPEVAMGSAATTRSDLYAVGVMLFEMLDGRPPFTADNINMMVALHAYQPAPELGPHVPRPLAHVVARTLAKKPEARPASAAELRVLLEAALRGEMPSNSGPIEATADSDEQSKIPVTRTTANRSPVALAETIQKQKLSPNDVSVTAESQPTGTGETARAVKRTNARWAFVLLALTVLGAIAVVAVMQMGKREKKTGETPAQRAVTITDAAEPVVAIDAGVLVDAPDVIVDAAAPPIDAGKRHGGGGDKKKIDAGAGTGTVQTPPPPPPPTTIDAGAHHPWDDPN
jgi:eukaryotic-like serine/threonine-protein kinase